MKKMMKFGCLGIIGLFVLLIVIGALVGGEDNETSNDKTDAEVKDDGKKDEGKKEESKKEEEVTVGVGQPLTVGDVTFTVSGVEDKTVLGDQYYSEKPTDGAVYKMIYMNIENKSKEALTVDSSFFNLEVDGAEYSPTTSTVLIEEMFFLEQINPNLSKKGTLIFEVPQGAGNMKLHVQTGFWGTETGVINIQ